MRYLAPILLTFGERGGVLLHNPQDTPPVLLVEVIPETIPHPRQSWAPRKGSGALGCSLLETDVKDL